MGGVKIKIYVKLTEHNRLKNCSGGECLMKCSKRSLAASLDFLLASF